MKASKLRPSKTLRSSSLRKKGNLPISGIKVWSEQKGKWSPSSTTTSSAQGSGFQVSLTPLSGIGGLREFLDQLLSGKNIDKIEISSDGDLRAKFIISCSWVGKATCQVTLRKQEPGPREPRKKPVPMKEKSSSSKLVTCPSGQNLSKN